MKYFLTLLSMLALLCSCYTEKKIALHFEDKSCNIAEFKNHLLFKYKASIFISKDKERFSPINFEIQLPKKVQFWEAVNGTNFGFYYKHNQVIFISTIPISTKEVSIDSVFIPSKNDIEKMVNNLETSGHKKWDIRKIRIMKSRKNIVIKKGNTTIFLLNIKEAYFEAYYHLVQSYSNNLPQTRNPQLHRKKIIEYEQNI